MSSEKDGKQGDFVHEVLSRLSGKSTGQTGVTKGAKQLQLSRHTTLQTGELESTRESIRAKDGNTQKKWEREKKREKELGKEHCICIHMERETHGHNDWNAPTLRTNRSRRKGRTKIHMPHTLGMFCKVCNVSVLHEHCELATAVNNKNALTDQLSVKLVLTLRLSWKLTQTHQTIWVMSAKPLHAIAIAWPRHKPHSTYRVEQNQDRQRFMSSTGTDTLDL